eukprot:3379658-Amphidinium_carterae.1
MCKEIHVFNSVLNYFVGGLQSPQNLALEDFQNSGWPQSVWLVLVVLTSLYMSNHKTTSNSSCCKLQSRHCVLPKIMR